MPTTAPRIVALSSYNSVGPGAGGVYIRLTPIPHRRYRFSTAEAEERHDTENRDS
jgi:hypothetical protein